MSSSLSDSTCRASARSPDQSNQFCRPAAINHACCTYKRRGGRKLPPPIALLSPKINCSATAAPRAQIGGYKLAVSVIPMWRNMNHIPPHGDPGGPREGM
jgi:hypothetical protein